jgi:hypothetical protein
MSSVVTAKGWKRRREGRGEANSGWHCRDAGKWSREKERKAHEGRARTVAQRTGSADAEGGARTRGEKRRREYQPAPPDQSDGCDTANNGDRRADGVARQRTEVETYDETKRRGTRKRKATYLVIDGQRAGARRDSIAAGAATLDRTVGQRYEWRDSGLADTKRRRSGPPGGARNGA